MDGITKIHIENTSRWTISECVKHVSHLMETEAAFISESRDKGCTFTFSGGVTSVSEFSRFARHFRKIRLHFISSTEASGNEGKYIRETWYAIRPNI